MIRLNEGYPPPPQPHSWWGARTTARFYASFHLIEQPIDAFWSAGATPVAAIARMASTSSRGALAEAELCAFVEPAAILEPAVAL